VRRLIAAFLVSTLGACGEVTTSGTGSGSFSGSVGGAALAVTDATLLNVAGSKQVVVVLSDHAGSCDSAKAKTQPPSSTGLGLLLTKKDGTAITVGDYTVISFAAGTVPDSYAWAMFRQADATCQPTIDSAGSSGTVTLTALSAVDGGTAQGSYSITFPSGETATGTFAAPFCSAQYQLLQTLACR
jgi:hypothetical protein